MEMTLTTHTPHTGGALVRMPEALPVRHKPELTVLSFGAGQDSTAILYLLAFNKEFRELYAPGKLIVVQSETGDEHPETYFHVSRIMAFCREQGIPFTFLEPEMGYHGWDGLREQYRKNTTVGSKAFASKACTGNLKIVPIYNYLEEFVGKGHNLPIGRKQAMIQFSKKFGKVRVLIGIAKGEEKRMLKPGEDKEKWKAQSVETVYPLVELGLDRGGCQRLIRAYGKPVPLPSNCMLCHYMSHQELLWLYRKYPADYQDWVEIEARKMDRFRNEKPADKNHGVWRSKSLPQVLEEAIEQFGHLSDEDLDTYKMSHGHCVASQY